MAFTVSREADRQNASYYMLIEYENMIDANHVEKNKVMSMLHNMLNKQTYCYNLDGNIIKIKWVTNDGGSSRLYYTKSICPEKYISLHAYLTIQSISLGIRTGRPEYITSSCVGRISGHPIYVSESVEGNWCLRHLVTKRL